MKASIRIAGVAVLASAALLAAKAQVHNTGTWPERPVNIVVAGPPGGGTDAIARIVAADLHESLHQTVVVDNRAGAGGIIGTRYVAGAAPDGNTLLMGQVSTNAIVPALVRPRPYDPVKDFVAIGIVGTAPDVLVVATNSGIHSFAELLAKAKASPKPLSYGSPGVGLSQHIAGFALARAAGVNMLHVPYRGSAPALTDLLGGQISMMFVTPGAAVPFLKSGQLRALAVTSHRRSRFLPDVPTVAELGYPGVEETGWFGLFAPAGTPPEVVQTLRTQLREAVARPQNHARFEALYLETAPDAATRDFPSFVQSEFGKWERAIQQLGVTSE